LQDRCGRIVAGGAQQAFQAGQPGRLVRLIEQHGDRSGLGRFALGRHPLAALRQGIAHLEADRTARLFECRLERGDRRGRADLPPMSTRVVVVRCLPGSSPSVPL